jgi:hypothetical protein
VADNDDVDMNLLLTMMDLSVLRLFCHHDAAEMRLLQLKRLPHGEGFSDMELSFANEVDES